MSAIKIKHTTYCGICGNKHEIEYDLAFNCETPKYCKPPDWVNLNNFLICDKHSMSDISEFLKSMV
jgi:hypothetical protein